MEKELRDWTDAERAALEDAAAAAVHPLRCPVCNAEVATGPGHDQWHIELGCTGCHNRTEWCWK